MTQKVALRIAGILGFLGVALGAFGAHALKGILSANGTVAIWEKAVFYHFIHAVMLYVLASTRSWDYRPWWCLLVGVTIFSGSLYLLAYTNLRWLGAVTPVGGLGMMAGWIWLALSPLEGKRRGG